MNNKKTSGDHKESYEDAELSVGWIKLWDQVFTHDFMFKNTAFNISKSEHPCLFVGYFCIYVDMSKFHKITVSF